MIKNERLKNWEKDTGLDLKEKVIEDLLFALKFPHFYYMIRFNFH